MKRFVKYSMMYARNETADDVAAWKASHPEPRHHGTTTRDIVKAIQEGHTRPKDIMKAIGLGDSATRMAVKRLVGAGTLVRTSSGYAIADVSLPQDESLAA